MNLTDDYAIGTHVEGSDRYPPMWTAAAAAFVSGQQALGRARMGQPYGAGAREGFDLFLPEGTPAGVMVFVHGGYWRNFDRASWSHLAAGALGRGWAMAMPSYDLCPAVRVSQITRQVAAAVTAIAEMVPGPVALTGHSAGGHLVARMLAPGMLDAQVAARLVSVVPIAPLTDLRPLLHTDMNADLRLTPDEADAESPVLQPRPAVPVTIWVGADERPALLEQARWLAEAWDAARVIVPDRHHFDVIDALADPDSDLVAALLGPRRDPLPSA